MAVAAFRLRREPGAFGLLFLAAVNLPGAVAAWDGANPAPPAAAASARSRPVARTATPAAGLPIVLARERGLLSWPASVTQARDAQRQGDVATAPDAVWLLRAEAPEPRVAAPIPAQPAAATTHLAGVETAGAGLGATSLLRIPRNTVLRGGAANDMNANAGSANAVAESPGPGGTSPTLALLADGTLVAATVRAAAGGVEVQAFRSTDAGTTWQAAGSIVSGEGLEPGRFVRDGAAVLWLPVLEQGRAMLPVLHLMRSADGGAGWQPVAHVSPPVQVHGAQLAVLGGGRMLCVARHGRQLLSANSRDGGLTWTAFHPCDLHSALEPVLVSAGGRAILLYTEVPADTTLAPPPVPVVREAISENAGVDWRRGAAVVVHPGWLPRMDAATMDAEGLVALLAEASPSQVRMVCRAWPAQKASGERGTNPARATAPGMAGAYGDSMAAARALRILAEFTAARPQRARRLFVEAYFMRTLVAAHDVLTPRGLGTVEPFEAATAVARAVSFADSLLVLQDKFGYWPLGYPAVWYADMGAAAAIFPAVEPYVDSERLQRYETAVDRFLRGLAREKMLWDSGAVGLGRELVHDPLGSRRRASPEPYLVSTALVGIETRAWMYHRTHQAEYRDAALKSLDYTLSQITPAGFGETQANKEGALRTVAYVQEGWMAADRYLDDPSVLPKLRRALRPHVTWLLGLQKPDGTWDGKGEGTFGRTPGIVDFLIWYDQRCEARADVRAAIRRAAATWTDPDRWDQAGLWRASEHHEVQRALVGRTLAALAAGRPVP